MPDSPSSDLILADPLWERVVITDGCWPWAGARIPAGYGRLRRNGKYVYAHRIAAELTYGPIPAGMYVCHTCDNPPCCRPDHLFIGTPTDNARDRDGKGRHWVRSGEASGGAVLQAIQVIDLRQRHALGASIRDLARELGVHYVTVWKIVMNRTWKTLRTGVVS